MFLAALEKQTAAERKGFLDEACGADAMLRARVQMLLEADARVRGILDRPGPGGPEQTAAYTSDELPGGVIAGRYKLLESIGEGGMGTVWVAEQLQPVRRKVALKLIKAGMDSKSVLARFEAERQALAIMDHPNIAKVLDGGLTETGRPYFVMEYVKGVRITEYCDAARLTVAERLQLFAQVCQAVQHAHQKGIIHRDLKPSNILVAPYDDKPVPKVIDFGLAKAMHQSLTERTLHTAHETVLGTPLYMSPEQAQLNNLDVDTRSDVYSLGVLLYELLTGTTPLEKKRFKEAAWDEVRRLIREEEPPRPSMRLSSTSTLPSLAAGRQTDPARLKKLVRGELDWIVMKSLEKDRSRRYETANGLAMDVQRYLAGEPVLAAPPSASYRLRKLVRRNKGLVLGAAAVVLAIAAGVAAVVLVQARANRELAGKNDELAAKNEALAAEQAKVEKRFELARKAIAKLHTGVSEDMLLKSDQFKDLRAQLLKETAEFYGGLEKMLEGQSDAKSRRLLAEGYFQLAELTGRIGSQPEGLALHRKALAVRRELAATDGADVETRLEIARSLGGLGYLLLWSDMAEALRVLAEQHDLAAALAKEAPTESVQAVLAQSLQLKGNALFNVGRSAEALAATEEAAVTLRKLAAENSADTEFRYDLARSRMLSGLLLWDFGKGPEAIEANESGCLLLEKLVKENPRVAKFRYRLGQGREDLAEFHLEDGRLDQTLQAVDKVRRISRELVETHPAVSVFQALLAESHSILGRGLAEVGKPAEAMTALNTALGFEQKAVEDNPTDIWAQIVLAGTYNRIGQTLAQTGRSGEALQAHENARALLEKPAKSETAFREVKRELALCLEKMGPLLAAAGKKDSALAAGQEALAIRKTLSDAQPDQVRLRGELAVSDAALGVVQRRVGRPAEAVASLRFAIELMATMPTLSPRSCCNLACWHAELAGIASEAGSGMTVEQRNAEAARAIEMLSQVIATGYDGVGRLQSDASLEAIRRREDFRKLLRDLEAKVVKTWEDKK